MKSAARIARTFRIDPLVVLDAEPFEWMVRAAAHNVIINDEKKAAEKAKRDRGR